jgi:hypothetical protein
MKQNKHRTRTYQYIWHQNASNTEKNSLVSFHSVYYNGNHLSRTKNKRKFYGATLPRVSLHFSSVTSQYTWFLELYPHSNSNSEISLQASLKHLKWALLIGLEEKKFNVSNINQKARDWVMIGSWFHSGLLIHPWALPTCHQPNLQLRFSNCSFFLSTSKSLL